jgi:hypothetical protein
MDSMIALLLFSIVPVDVVTREHVDAIEVNRVYGDDGRVSLEQVIFWRRQWGSGQEMHTASWRMSNKSPGIKPVGKESVFIDGNHFRHITAGSVFYTTTMHDPEQCDLLVWPKDWRCGLRGEETFHVQGVDSP